MDLDVHELGIGARVRHPEFGVGVVYELNDRTAMVFFKDHGEQNIVRSFRGMEVTAPGPDLQPERDDEVDVDPIKDALREVLEEMLDTGIEVEMASKWEGGLLVMEPANESLQSKEVPMETFFHKIVMMRDRLRVLEQKVNGHPKLSEAEKVELQQYITRIYGSMTTFNVLFAGKDEGFTGERGGG